MINLISAIKGIESELESIKYEYRRTIAPLEDSLEKLREVNETCERCEGKGKVLRSRVCAEDDRPNPKDPRDYDTCPECRGTGVAKYARDRKK